VTEEVDDVVDLPQRHAINRFRCCSSGHCPGIPVDSSIREQVEFAVEEQSIHTFEWQTTSATFPNDM
jgi:hypothetical protein